MDDDVDPKQEEEEAFKTHDQSVILLVDGDQVHLQIADDEEEQSPEGGGVEFVEELEAAG